MSAGMTVRTLVALLTGASLLVGSAAHAGGPADEPAPPPPEDGDDGTFRREMEVDESETSGSDGSSDGGEESTGASDDGDGESGGGSGDGDGESVEPPPVIPCTWSAPPSSQSMADSLNTVFTTIESIIGGLVPGSVFDVEFFVEGGTLRRWNGSSGEAEQYQVADCTGANEPGVVTGDVRWRVVAPPTPAVLIPGLRLVVSGIIEPPESAINPPAEAPVNLGLWLAVVDDGPIVAEGRLGPLWARGTATLTATTFDPGNGDGAVTCHGGGVVIEDLDTTEQGPCGYTYGSLADVNNEGLEITVRSTWTIVWETSDANASAGPPETMTRTTVVPYDVYEIQTVGTG